MLCFSGFELYSRWVPLMFGLSEKKSGRCREAAVVERWTLMEVRL